MPSEFTMESIEIIVGAMLAVAMVGAVVFTVVGTITFLFAWERESEVADAPVVHEHPSNMGVQAA